MNADANLPEIKIRWQKARLAGEDADDASHGWDDAKRLAIVASWQDIPILFAELTDLRHFLHSRLHPGYEYETTTGPRKAWDYSDVPPNDDGWERNTEAGDEGWERMTYHEESYWRREVAGDHD